MRHRLSCVNVHQIASDTTAIEAAVSALHPFTLECTESRSFSFYDTFDWRLFKRSLVVRRSGNRLDLVSLDSGKILHASESEERPVFAWDLPESGLRKMLSSLLEARALFELASIDVEKTTYRVLNNNEDDRTVARVLYVTARASSSGDAPVLSSYVCVCPYTGHVRRLVRQLALGEPVRSLDEAIYLDALTAGGRTPNDYSSRIDVQLDPGQRADEATKAVLRRLLQTMRANEEGIRADIDVEFLHDYRVAIRRTRSALSQVGGVFPAEITKRFQQDFRNLGRRTNQLRDLDVYLLAETRYRAMLPAAIRQDVAPLFDLLRSQRSETLAYVIEGLNDPEHETILSVWADFLDQPGQDDPTAPNAGMPIIELARKRIYKRYRRIVKDGTHILDHTEDELLHALRLECKRLRYLLEFFASLFPEKKVNRQIKQLKRLQDNLGDFTDLSVQQESLLAVAQQLPDDVASTRGALDAVGALVSTLAQQQQAVKADFSKTFTRFAAPASRQAYQTLFAPRKKKPGRKRKRS